MAKSRKQPAPFPSKEALRSFIENSPTPVGKREIARAFRISGAERPRLKALLKELQEEGVVERSGGRKLTRPEGLPGVTVLEVAGLDPDGEQLARPVAWRGDGPPPTIYLAPERRSRADLEEGERVLARLTRSGEASYEARIIRVLGKAARRVLGIYRPEVGEGRLKPTDKRARDDFVLRRDEAAGAEAGELVLAEVIQRRRRSLGLHEVRVVDRLGDASDARAISLISIHEHDIPVEFPETALAEAEAAGPVELGDRVDLRALPLVTIDGADARDFDDAVWAEADRDGENPGGWHLLVAIADVAHYVKAGGALDQTAEQRGNSVYFPDRVVAMLPEALSNGWCSLRPEEDRGCLTAEIWIDSDGRLLRHRFQRALMQSSARLTYEQVQEARNGKPDAVTAPLMERVIEPLYGAFAALLRARQARGTLDFELPERLVRLDDQGHVKSITPRQRLDSHRLIEEFMIAANVAAAITLEERGRPCMYRVHEGPDPVKVEALSQFLEGLGLSLARGQALRPKVFTRLLDQVRASPYEAMVNELVLRAQSQAFYSPENLGHFGLALPRYAHFTSPIRRYSDLLVHRSLIGALSLGRDSLPPAQAERMASIGEQISMTERRAAAAERAAKDRFTASYLRSQVGSILQGRVNGVTRFGLFVTLDETGADGLIPISSLPDDFYDHDESQHALIGRRWGRSYQLGESVSVRLVEADPVTGGIVLNLFDSEEALEDRSAQPSVEGGWDPLTATGRQSARRKKSATRQKPKKVVKARKAKR